jgi:hypothetical protein
MSKMLNREYREREYKRGYEYEVDSSDKIVDSVTDLVTDLNGNGRMKHFGCSYIVREMDELVVRVQVSNGPRPCAACNSNHMKFIVQRIYAKTPRIGTGTKFLTGLATIAKEMHGGVWIQQAMTAASKGLCKKLGASKHMWSFSEEFTTEDDDEMPENYDLCFLPH